MKSELEVEHGNASRFPMKIQILPLLEIANSPLVSEWNDLVIRTGVNPSFIFEWMSIIADCHKLSREVEVFLIRSNDSLVCAIPFLFKKTKKFGIPINRVELLSNFICYHNQILGTEDAGTCLQAFLDYIDTRRWDLFWLVSIQDETYTHKAIKALDSRRNLKLFEHSAEKKSPYLKVDGDWRSYLDSKPKKFRYKLRQRDKFRQNSDTTVLWFRNSDCAEQFLRELLEIDSESWKAEQGVAVGDSEIESTYHKMLIPFLAEEGMLSGCIMHYRGEPIAYNLCCTWRGWHGQLKTSFKKKHAELSPGSCVIDLAIMEAFEQEATEFDFLGGEDRHKLQWTKTSRDHVNIDIYNLKSVAGRLLSFLKTVKSTLFS